MDKAGIVDLDMAEMVGIEGRVDCTRGERSEDSGAVELEDTPGVDNCLLHSDLPDY